MNKRNEAIDEVLGILRKEMEGHELAADKLDSESAGWSEEQMQATAVAVCIVEVSKMERGIDPLEDPMHIGSYVRLVDDRMK